MLSIDQMKTIERRLAVRAAGLEHAFAAAPRRDDDTLAQVSDAKDAAELEARTVVADAEVERDLAELRDIEVVRERLKEGSYGTCVDCGAGIDARRLLAQLQTLRCLECQAVAERASTGTKASHRIS